MVHLGGTPNEGFGSSVEVAALWPVPCAKVIKRELRSMTIPKPPLRLSTLEESPVLSGAVDRAAEARARVVRWIALLRLSLFRGPVSRAGAASRPAPSRASGGRRRRAW